jgi:peptidyl-prolyl cis-trans isomerase B (cyclophilin B)
MKIEIKMQDGGIMRGELYPETAPITVDNFIKLINEKFFDGLIFHRVIEDFMIQGGGYSADGSHKETASIKGEFDSNGIPNPLKHTRGILSMARTSFPNSASSQFFIMHKDAPHLDGQYAAFGKITEGLETLDKIACTKTNFSDEPLIPQIIEYIKLI